MADLVLPLGVAAGVVAYVAVLGLIHRFGGGRNG